MPSSQERRKENNDKLVKLILEGRTLIREPITKESYDECLRDSHTKGKLKKLRALIMNIFLAETYTGQKGEVYPKNFVNTKAFNETLNYFCNKVFIDYKSEEGGNIISWFESSLQERRKEDNDELVKLILEGRKLIGEPITKESYDECLRNSHTLKTIIALFMDILLVETYTGKNGEVYTEAFNETWYYFGKKGFINYEPEEGGNIISWFESSLKYRIKRIRNKKSIENQRREPNKYTFEGDEINSVENLPICDQHVELNIFIDHFYQWLSEHHHHHKSKRIRHWTHPTAEELIHIRIKNIMKGKIYLSVTLCDTCKKYDIKKTSTNLTNLRRFYKNHCLPILQEYFEILIGQK